MRGAAGFLTLILGFGCAMANATTLDSIRARGALNCGVSEGVPGFSFPENANWSGVDVDLCRAIAAAIFDDASRVTFRALSAKDRFTALEAGEVDLLARNSTFTLSRNTALGLEFPVINFYDGQGFLVKKSLNVKSVAELDGAVICTQAGTTTELNVGDYFRIHHLKFDLRVLPTLETTEDAFLKGRCTALTDDHSALAAERSRFKAPNDYMILPETISKEPLAPAIKAGDSQWAEIVRWTFYAMVAAEELDVSQKNIDQMKLSPNPEVRRLLGQDEDLGQGLGLTPDWAYRIIHRVGNYGESFERNLGATSGLGMARGLNALWKDGGLQYAPPIR